MADVGQKRKADDDANGGAEADAAEAEAPPPRAAQAAMEGGVEGTPPPDGEISDMGKMFWKGGLAVRGICENPYRNPDEDGPILNDPVLRRLKENFAGGSVLDHKRRRTGDNSPEVSVRISFSPDDCVFSVFLRDAYNTVM